MIASQNRTSARDGSGEVTTSPATISCPECGCLMRFETEVCDICLADLGERSTPFPTADLPPAAAMTDLCFGDVMAELEALAQLAYEREEVAEAAHRAGSLLVRLRTQFLRELDLPGAPRAGTSAAPR